MITLTKRELLEGFQHQKAVRSMSRMTNISTLQEMKELLSDAKIIDHDLTSVLSGLSIYNLPQLIILVTKIATPLISEFNIYL